MVQLHISHEDLGMMMEEVAGDGGRVNWELYISLVGLSPWY
jgi:hypothetical protein